MEKLMFGLALLNVDNIWRIYSKDEITEYYANLAKIVDLHVTGISSPRITDYWKLSLNSEEYLRCLRYLCVVRIPSVDF